MNLKELQASIKARNTRFAKLSPAKKRAAVARDVLKLITTKKIKPTHGIYVGLKKRGAEVLKKKSNAGRDLAELLPQIPTCNTCALGSLFLATVTRADKMKVSPPVDYFGPERPEGSCRVSLSGGILQYDTYNYLEDYFDHDQLEVIEMAFEHAESYGNPGYRQLRKLSPMSATERIQAIMRNIIKNKGTFRPAQLV